MKKHGKYLFVLCIFLFFSFFVYISYSGINLFFLTSLSGINYKTTEVTTWNELKNAISDDTCNKIIIKSNLVANSAINIKNKEITIISNNNVTINRDSSFTGYFFKITNGSKLYFGDSNYKIEINSIQTLKSDTIFIAEDSNLNLNNISVNNNYSLSDGGAVRIIRSTSNISNSSFDSNMGVYGGAICVYSYTPKSTLTIINSNITNNTSYSQSGGGIYAYGNLTISNSNISNNTAETYGGGIIVKDYAQITNTTFDSNTAKNNSGGGIRVDGKLKINGGSITNNVAKKNGGGLDYEVGELVDLKSIYKLVSISGNNAGFSNNVFPDPNNIIEWKEDKSLNLKNVSDSLTLLKRFSIGNHEIIDGILEGMSSNSNYIVFSVVISDSDKTYLYVLDKDNMNIKSINSDYYLNHANDITYNSKTGYFYVVTANKRLGKFKINSNGIITDFSFLNISGDYSAIAYDKDDDYFISYGIVKESNNYVKKIFIMDNNFNIIRSFNSPTNLTSQGMGYYNHKIYFACFESGYDAGYQTYFSIGEKNSNIIYVYNMDGSLDRTLYFPNTKINGEMESVHILDNDEMIVNYSIGYGSEKKFEFYKSDYLKNIDSVRIKENPKKTTYIQNKESLDLNGGLLEIIYNSGKKDILLLSDTNVNVSGFNNSVIGNNIIKVKYKNKETHFTINIVAESKTVEETPPVDKTVEETPPLDEKTKETPPEDTKPIDEKSKEDEIQEDESGKDDSKIIEDKTIHEETTQKYNQDNNIIIYILCAVVVAFIPIAINVFLKK